MAPAGLGRALACQIRVSQARNGKRFYSSWLYLTGRGMRTQTPRRAASRAPFSGRLLQSETKVSFKGEDALSGCVLVLRQVQRACEREKSAASARRFEAPGLGSGGILKSLPGYTVFKRRNGS